MRPAKHPLFVAFLALGTLSLALLAGCTPEIGDKCLLSTDCSQRGDRLCDTSQPDGYCTVFNCTTNSCPDEAACVTFGTNIPGCSVNDRGVARSARSFCVASCGRDSDCRSGYVCDDPRSAPWLGAIMDNNQDRRVCLVAASGIAPVASGNAPVCQSAAPEAGAFVPSEAGGDASSTGAEDAGADSASDAAQDSGVDAALDSGVISDAGDAG